MIPPEFSGRCIPDIAAGASARSLLVDIHTAIGHQSGAMEEMARQVSELARTLHGHIEEEGCVTTQLDALIENSRERHELLHKRLDQLERYSTVSRIRWGVAVALGGLACTLIGGMASALMTVGFKAVGRALGLS